MDALLSLTPHATLVTLAHVGHGQACEIPLSGFAEPGDSLCTIVRRYGSSVRFPRPAVSFSVCGIRVKFLLVEGRKKWCQCARFLYRSACGVRTSIESSSS